jgi:hypothetical protein
VRVHGCAPYEPAVNVLTKELDAAHQRVLKNVVVADEKMRPVKNIMKTRE